MRGVVNKSHKLAFIEMLDFEFDIRFLDLEILYVL
jgi:hypothetical protein